METLMLFRNVISFYLGPKTSFQLAGRSMIRFNEQQANVRFDLTEDVASGLKIGDSVIQAKDKKGYPAKAWYRTSGGNNWPEMTRYQDNLNRYLPSNRAIYVVGFVTLTAPLNRRGGVLTENFILLATASDQQKNPPNPEKLSLVCSEVGQKCCTILLFWPHALERVTETK